VIRVELPWACFGLLVHDGRVAGAPPIASWCTGRPAPAMWDYWQRRGALVTWMP
jgi:hypothetical protein